MSDSPDPSSTAADRLARALTQADASARLQAALTAGTSPDVAFLTPLVEQCAIEPDFSVREMLTWALTRLSHELVLESVTRELASPTAQAREQALHTLSKLRDPRAWPAITAGHLHDANDAVAQTAWRTSVGLAPVADHQALAHELQREFGRGDFEIHRSLARAVAELGDAGSHVAQASLLHQNSDVRIHAAATLRVINDPDAAFFLDPSDA